MDDPALQSYLDRMETGRPFPSSGALTHNIMSKRWVLSLYCPFLLMVMAWIVWWGASPVQFSSAVMQSQEILKASAAGGFASHGRIALFNDAMPEFADARSYVGSATCKTCHATEYEDWQGSNHQRAMQPANADTIGEHFNDETFTSHGVTTRFHRNELGELFITRSQEERADETFAVKYVFGDYPLQQFLIEMGDDGRLQAYTVAWDVENARWYHLYPDEDIDELDALHWSRHVFNWNLACAECHSTDLQENYDARRNSYATTFAEVSVGCEACHGPASEHVLLANQTEPLTWGDDPLRGLTIPLRDIEDNRIEIESCAPCHSRRSGLTQRYLPGNRFLDHYAPELLEPDLYFEDGQIRDEVFVYGSFLQSRMYRENVKCSDCHNPHSTALKFEGNANCTQCHKPQDYDTTLHHHHQPGGEGQSCIECHMPERTYMGIDPRRDHSIRVPRPDLTVEFGVPNACQSCHTKENETAEWAAETIVDWYGPVRASDPHYAHAFASARIGSADGFMQLKEIIRDATKYGPITRGTAAQLLFSYVNAEDVQEFVVRMAKDREPLVRFGAVQAIAGIADEGTRLRMLEPFMRDRVRAVQVEVGRLLGSFSVDDVEEKYQRSFERCRGAYDEWQQVNADSPAALLNHGVRETNAGRFDDAVASYMAALRIAPTFHPAMTNLALLHYDHDNYAQAEQLLRESIRVEPDFAHGYFLLALLLGGSADPDEGSSEVESLLKKGLDIEPTRADIRYNYAVILHQRGDLDGAEREYLQASADQPDYAEPLWELFRLYVQRERWPAALEQLAKLQALDPANPAWPHYRSLIQDRQDGG